PALRLLRLRLLLAQALGQVRDAALDLAADSPVPIDIFSIRIAHRPILYSCLAVEKNRPTRRSGHVDDDLGFCAPHLVQALRVLAIDRYAAFLQDHFAQVRNLSERREARARGLHHVGSQMPRQRFGHLAATRVPNANKQDLGSFHCFRLRLPAHVSANPILVVTRSDTDSAPPGGLRRTGLPWLLLASGPRQSRRPPNAEKTGAPSCRQSTRGEMLRPVRVPGVRAPACLPIQ